MIMKFPEIEGAKQRSKEKRARLQNALREIRFPQGCAMVVFGSLARDEFTSGSDIDWTLLIDGSVQANWHQTVAKIREQLAANNIPAPNVAGPFGSASSSFDLIRYIGGDHDSNRITTQRVLLLLESKPLLIGEESAREVQRGVYERVCRALIDSYLEQSSGDKPHDVPRFLLNDIVRYWRTMTVDYAAKRRERGGAGSAIRKLKLRTSRKLIFASGLVMALSYCVRLSSEGRGSRMKKSERSDELRNALLEQIKRTPLEVLESASSGSPQMQREFERACSHYNDFLRLMNNADDRALLEAHAPSDEQTELLMQAEGIADGFGRALEKFFFDYEFKGAIR